MADVALNLPPAQTIRLQEPVETLLDSAIDNFAERKTLVMPS
jgi:hypothetical protein